MQLAQEEFLLSQKKRLEDEDKWRLRVRLRSNRSRLGEGEL